MSIRNGTFIPPELMEPFFYRLRGLYDRMDRRYADVAGDYGFVCRGCEDNCCRTRFYHHTFIEYYYLRRGFETLDADRKQSIRRRARIVDQIFAVADRRAESPKEMCPLNVDGRCILYAQRPMICRLHGIPHELHTPAKGTQRHPGCSAFENQCRPAAYIRFDRTPFYIEMSALERDVKSTLGRSQSVKMTVARMLLPRDPAGDAGTDARTAGRTVNPT